jgi:hypothetical protein
MALTFKLIPPVRLKHLIFDLSREINDCASVVKLDIQKHIKEAKSIEDESGLKPLAPATVAMKSKAKAGWMYDGKPLTGAQAAKIRRHATDPLQATENLLMNQKIAKATSARQVAEIEIGPTREKIYFKYLDEARTVWGISDGTVAKIDELIIARCDRLLARHDHD